MQAASQKSKAIDLELRQAGLSLQHKFMFYIVSCDSTLEITTPDARRWAVEATTERQAIELVRNTIGESARMAGLSVSELTNEARLQNPALQSLGVTEVIVEIGADTADQVNEWEPEFLIQPLSLRDEATPSWLPAGLWPQLLVTPDGGRAYGIVTADVWDAAAPGAEMRAVPLWDTTLLAGDADEVSQSAPVLVDLSLDGYSDTPPTTLHRLLAILGKRTPMILRSNLDLPQLQRNLRKLVMVVDVNGRRYFNRFWEPEFFLYMLTFLGQRAFMAPLAGVTHFAAVIEDDVVSTPLDFSGAPYAVRNKEQDLDLLFAAGIAMVALRHCRFLESEFKKGCDQDIVFQTANRLFDLTSLDYADVGHCIEVCYSALEFYGDRVDSYLTPDVCATCQENGVLSMMFHDLHGRYMFGLRHAIAPHLLHPVEQV